jgi:hypothetical protein
MAGKGHFLRAGEDAYLRCVLRILRRQDEGRFGVVELCSDLLHLFAAHATRIQNDTERIVAEALRGKDVDRDVWNRAHTEERSGGLPSI